LGKGRDGGLVEGSGFTVKLVRMGEKGENSEEHVNPQSNKGGENYVAWGRWVMAAGVVHPCSDG
jgi:hypothetical protein